MVPKGHLLDGKRVVNRPWQAGTSPFWAMCLWSKAAGCGGSNSSGGKWRSRRLEGCWGGEIGG